MRPFSRGQTLLALLTLAALAVWRASGTHGDRSVRGAGGGDVPPPALRLEPRTLDLGCVPPGTRHELVLGWARVGRGPLRVLGTHTGCGCLGLCGLPDVLPEGASGSLTLTFAAPSAPGPASTQARVVLDAPPPDDVLRITLEAFVGERLVAEPACLALGRRSLGGAFTQRFAVALPPQARAATVTAALVGVEGTCLVEPSPLRSQHGPDVLVTLRLPAQAGTVEAALTLAAPGAGTCVVPLSAVVVAVAPPRDAPTQGP